MEAGGILDTVFEGQVTHANDVPSVRGSAWVRQYELILIPDPFRYGISNDEFILGLRSSCCIGWFESRSGYEGFA